VAGPVVCLNPLLGVGASPAVALLSVDTRALPALVPFRIIWGGGGKVDGVC